MEAADPVLDEPVYQDVFYSLEITKIQRIGRLDLFQKSNTLTLYIPMTDYYGKILLKVIKTVHLFIFSLTGSSLSHHA